MISLVYSYLVKYSHPLVPQNQTKKERNMPGSDYLMDGAPITPDTCAWCVKRPRELNCAYCTDCRESNVLFLLEHTLLAYFVKNPSLWGHAYLQLAASLRHIPDSLIPKLVLVRSSVSFGSRPTAQQR